MTFLEAVNSTPSIERRLKAGLQALPKSDRKLVSFRGPELRGSVDIDKALLESYPNDARWDYVIGIRAPGRHDSAVWIEVHSASSSHVDEVLNKLVWLKRWLATSAPAMNQLPAKFCWIATSTVSFRPGSPHANRIAKAGLRFPVKHLALEKVLKD
jgi:hypothetical protein